MSGRCQTCKHWTPTEAWDVKAGGLRKCAAVREKWDVEDEVPEEVREGRDGLAWDDEGERIVQAYAAAAEVVFGRAKAVVVDGSQYHAELLTRPDFGCVLYLEG